MAAKRTLDRFFAPVSVQKPRVEPSDGTEQSTNATYPFPVPNFPTDIKERLCFVPAAEGREVNEI